MSRILIVEDEQHLADGLQFNLEAEGYDVTVLDNGEAALEELGARSGDYDLLLLDVMLPGIDGFEVISTLRGRGWYGATLMLTARGRPDDVLKGFGAGADDYLPKPFELAILLARIKGLLRRQSWNALDTRPGKGPVLMQGRYQFQGKTIDFDELELQVGARTMTLTLMEANLLAYLIKNEGRAVSRNAILEDVWGVREDTDTRAIDNFIVRLRRYLEDDPSNPRHVVTVRGVGYRFFSNPAE